MRNLTTVMMDDLAGSRVRLFFVVEFQFKAGTVRFSTTPDTFYLGGTVEYLGAGGLLNIEFSQEDSSLESHKCEITLNGLDPAVISLALNEQLENAPCIISLCTLDAETNAFSGMQIFHRGTVGQIRIVPPTDSGTLS